MAYHRQRRNSWPMVAVALVGLLVGFVAGTFADIDPKDPLGSVQNLLQESRPLSIAKQHAVEELQPDIESVAATSLLFLGGSTDGVKWEYGQPECIGGATTDNGTCRYFEVPATGSSTICVANAAGARIEYRYRIAIDVELETARSEMLEDRTRDVLC